MVSHALTPMQAAALAFALAAFYIDRERDWRAQQARKGAELTAWLLRCTRGNGSLPRG